ncbi:MAG: PocR ligand-binding domain-containing protein [Treponema sp.]|nr:PocR ligand-binding domain-containing protein [Treponema sp.]
MTDAEGKTILLVEDEILIAMMEKRQLEQEGYRVLHVNSGEKAVELVRAGKEVIDIVLMDINLGPGIDGTEAAAEILKSKDMPLVFLSSHTEREIVRKTEEITNYGYVVKNSGITVLDASIKMAFKLFLARQNIQTQRMDIEAAYEEMQVANEELIASEERLIRSESSVRNRLKAIMEPDGDLGDLELSDIIDTDILQSLLEDFHRLTGILGAILDVSGKVLVAVGWQDICTKFHRCNPDSLKNCLESDTLLTKGVRPKTFKTYRCKNNMWDMVTPLIIGGRHMGNVFIGQFIYDDEEPDIEMFRAQARRYGFEEEAYLAALHRVPRFSKETVDAGMRFYARLSEIISSMSYGAIQRSRMLAAGDRTQEALLMTTERLRLATEMAGIAVWEYDFNSNSMTRSDNHDALYGLAPQPHWDIGTFLAATYPDDRKLSNYYIEKSVAPGGPDRYEFDFRVVFPDASIRWLNVKGQVIRRDDEGRGVIVRGCLIDITEWKA